MSLKKLKGQLDHKKEYAVFNIQTSITNIYIYRLSRQNRIRKEPK